MVTLSTMYAHVMGQGSTRRSKVRAKVHGGGWLDGVLKKYPQIGDWGLGTGDWDWGQPITTPLTPLTTNYHSINPTHNQLPLH